MPVTAVLDLAYGDTGKARIIDYLAKDYDTICRFNGSSNCGHTIVYNGNKYLTRMIPSGFLYNKDLLITQGVMLDLQVFLDELKQFDQFSVNSKLIVSNKCQLLLPYHKQADINNEANSNTPIGSTKNGVAFAMQDKVGRRGIRICDLDYKGNFVQKIKENAKFWNITDQLLIDKSISLINELLNLQQKKLICIVDTSKYINSTIDDINYLCESAQGHYLDIENGFYPYVTTVPCSAAGVCLGMNIAPKKLTKVIGITKAYITKVGLGPLKTELFNDIADQIRRVGNEFGSVTGRPRRIGWLNLDELKEACIINGVDELAITKCDVLNNIETKVYMNGSYITMKPWKDYSCQEFSEYLDLIEKHCRVHIKYVSYGADRNEIMER